MRPDAQTEAALPEILERFCSGFAAGDAEGVMRLFAPDADVVMVTSEESFLRGPDEVRASLIATRGESPGPPGRGTAVASLPRERSAGFWRGARRPWWRKRLRSNTRTG